MQIKKTGKLFVFACLAPALIVNKDKKIINRLEKIGHKIGLLFQIVDDLIDYRGNSKKVGKKTKKDKKKGKATLINFQGYQNTIKYAHKLKVAILKKLAIFGKKGDSLRNTIQFILERDK